MRWAVVVILAICLTVEVANIAEAQDPSMCGQAPRVDDELLEGELDGRAKFLSSFLGDAGLTGKIKSERKDIFSKTPETLKERANAYMQYQVCMLLMSDKSLSTSQKINELIRVQQSFSDPIK